MLKKEVKQHLYVIILTLIFIALIYYTITPTLIGHVILETSSHHSLDFSDLSYDSDLIEITDEIKLKSTSLTYNWTTYSQEEFTIFKAYHNPSDKTSKIETLDNDKQRIDPGKIANFVFENYLDNEDLIQLYLDEEATTNIYLCPANIECDYSTPNYGHVYFPNQEGYYNLTLQNLPHPTKVFNLNAEEKVKLDYITSPQSNISKLFYNPSDKTSKIETLDNDKLEINKNEILDLVFNNVLQSNDLLQLYLKTGDPTDIYICESSTPCSSPGYGLISYDGSEGWFNLTLTNLEYPLKALNLDPTEIKIDFANILRITATEHSQTNITYPPNATLTTPDLTISNLKTWDLLEIDQDLNNQNITYEYSTESGETWFSIPASYNLSEINSSQIQFRITLLSDTLTTPLLKQLNITYTTSEDIPTYYEINNSETISTLENTPLIINASDLKTELNILPTTTSNLNLSITPLENKNTPNSTKSTLSKVKGLEINAPELNTQNATLKIYYTDSEISNIKESSLKIYYYNETSQDWQALNTILNTEDNYLEANLEHFSIYGIFGEEKSSESSSSSFSSSSPTGTGGTQTFTRGTPKPEAPSAPQETTETQTQSQPLVKTETENLPVQTKTTFTGQVINISKILTSGKLNKVLWILFTLLIIAYILVRLHEKKILNLKPKFKI